MLNVLFYICLRTLNIFCSAMLNRGLNLRTAVIGRFENGKKENSDFLGAQRHFLLHILYVILPYFELEYPHEYISF